MGCQDSSIATGPAVAKLLAKRASACLCLVAVVAALVASPAAAQSLDTTFGGDGIVTTGFVGEGSFDTALALARQTDGKLVAAGNVDGGSCFGCGGDFSLARYNADGTLDTTFDADGGVVTSFSPGAGDADEARAVAIQTDGKIVVAGIADNTETSFDDFAVARYNADGTPDTTFSTDGVAYTTFTAGDRANAVAIQTDGKIVVAGTNGFNGFAVARYNTDGSPDTGFDGDGKVVTPIDGSQPDEAHGVALQTDGKIVAAGQTDLSTIGDFGVVRYNTNGSLDTGFDTDGIATTDGFEGARAVAIQSDGKIVAAGEDFETGFALTRYNTNGSPDTSFDGDGKVATDLGGVASAKAHALALQADGKLVAAGTNDACGFDCDFAIARYNTNGSLDTTFDADGRSTTAVAPPDQIDIGRAVLVPPDGKAVIAGYADIDASDFGDLDFGLVRYKVNGDDVAPSPPTVTGTDPASPSNDNSPAVKGTAEAGSTVRVYTSSDCTGTAVATGSEASFASTGLTTTDIPSNATTTFRATATDAAGNASGCSTSSIAYVEDSSPPSDPSLTDTDPDSPANDTTPLIKGSADAGTTVNLYTNPFCSTLAATGSAAELASPGLPVSVGDNTSTTFYARATDTAGNTSGCGIDPIFYVADSNPPETTISSGPEGTTSDNTPTFGFSSSEGELSSTFECRVDGGAYAGCTSPVTTGALSDGPHAFGVRATDAAGNLDPTEASRSFTVNTSVASPPTDSPPADTGDEEEDGPTAGDDLLAGDALANVICGLGGDDEIDGGAGNDTLWGDACNDVAKILASQAGTDGDDVLNGDDGNDRLYGAGGRDTLRGGRGNDRLFGGAGNDALSGAAGRDALDGGTGNDRLTGGADVNSYKGGSGNDVVSARNRKRETVNCGSGGRDTATVDRNDKVRGCEKVKRPRR